MLPDILLIIISLVVPIGLTACILILLRSHKTQEARLRELEEEKMSLQGIASKQVQKITEDALSEAIKIIATANDNAKQILTQAQTLKGQKDAEAQNNFETLMKSQHDAFQKATDDIRLSLQNSIDQLKTEDINILKKLTNNIETDVTQEIGDFKKVLEQETISSQKIVGQKIEEEFKKTQAEAQAYKAEELHKVDEEIEELIKTTTEKVIHKSLSLNDHYDLVEEALKEAKATLKLSTPQPTIKEEAKTTTPNVMQA